MANGGIIGPINITSKGGNKVTSKTSSGNVTTQPGTRLVQTLVVAGGGSGGAVSPSHNTAGGGGAGGYRCISNISVCGNTSYPITIGAGGASRSGPTDADGNSGSNSSAFCQSSTGGGGGAR